MGQYGPFCCVPTGRDGTVPDSQRVYNPYAQAREIKHPPSPIMLLYRLYTLTVLVAGCAAALAHRDDTSENPTRAIAVLRHVAEPRTLLTPSRCNSNADCIRKGLPLLPPRPRRIRRADDPFTSNLPGIVKTFSASGQAETYRTPKMGIYTIRAVGASGGTSGGAGGLGADITATIFLPDGIDLVVVAGREGVSGAYGAGYGAGGGGGSFVYIDTAIPPLVAAGGGGGSGYGNGGDVCNAVSENGADGATASGGGSEGGSGTDRSGGSSKQPGAGGGGAGFFTDGSDNNGDYPAGGGKTAPGFAGGFGYDPGTAVGGFGGGGGGGFNGGGGGGGNAGGGGGSEEGDGGGGGASYAHSPLTYLGTLASGPGDGYVLITAP